MQNRLNSAPGGIARSLRPVRPALRGTGPVLASHKGDIMKRALLASAAISVMLTGAAWANIKIATAGPMTGQYAAFGAQMKAGAEQAVADINAKGGVNGEQLELSVGDDA